MSVVSFKVRLFTAEPLENGKCPVVIQVSWRDSKPQIRRKRLGISCHASDWDRNEHCFKNTARSAVRLNAELKDALLRAENIYYTIDHWDYKTWARCFDDKESSTMTFDAFAKDLTKQMFAMGRAGNAVYYRDCLRAVQKFLHREQIEFGEINKKMLKKLEVDFLARGYKGERTMRGLKAIFSKAVEDEAVDMKLMPFKTAYNPVGYKFNHLKKVRTRKKRTRLQWLSIDQLTKILTYQPESEAEERAMDLWKVSYYTMGTNLKDIALMKRSDLRDGQWFFEREKTQDANCGTHILPEVTEIITKYDDQENEYVFDFILQDKYDVNEQAIRDRMDNVLSNLWKTYTRISSKLGLPGHFTFYSARYTSSSVSTNRGADLRAIQSNMAHASITTTEKYTLYSNREEKRRSIELLRV